MKFPTKLPSGLPSIPSFPGLNVLRRKEEIGQSPFDYHLATKGDQPPKLDVYTLTNDSCEKRSYNSLEEFKKSDYRDKLIWLDVHGFSNAAFLDDVKSHFDLPPQAVTDVTDTLSRPKLIDYPTALFISLKMVWMLENEIRVEHISMILMDGIVMTFQQEEGDVFDRVRERFAINYSKIKERGEEYILYMLMDSVTDNYLYVTGVLGEKIEEIDLKTFTSIDRKTLHEINALKSGLNFLRRNVIPGRDVAGALSKIEEDWIREKNKPFFVDLYNNAVQATDALDSFRDMLSDQLSIYHTNVSANLNDIMKFLTMFSVVFIPTTFIAGVYGTNFEHIPELSNPNGYYIMWGAMIVITILLLLYFRYRKWL